MKELLPYLAPIITLVTGWLLGKRKNKADVQKTEVETVSVAISIWRQLAQDLRKEVDELRVIVENLKEENEKLTFEICELKNQRI
jgi:archaellum component FlaC